jgi:hypothetical protein
MHCRDCDYARQSFIRIELELDFLLIVPSSLSSFYWPEHGYRGPINKCQHAPSALMSTSSPIERLVSARRSRSEMQ